MCLSNLFLTNTISFNTRYHKLVLFFNPMNKRTEESGNKRTDDRTNECWVIVKMHAK